VGYVVGAVVSGLLMGRFLPVFLKTKAWYPAGIMAVLSVLGMAAGVAGYLNR
jgi:F0F1-type ATP synthase assembly protein I